LANFRILARKEKKEKEKKKEGPCENPYKEWIFVEKNHTKIAIF
jgi:hypothetical protein